MEHYYLLVWRQVPSYRELNRMLARENLLVCKSNFCITASSISETFNFPRLHVWRQVAISVQHERQSDFQSLLLTVAAAFGKQKTRASQRPRIKKA